MPSFRLVYGQRPVATHTLLWLTSTFSTSLGQKRKTLYHLLLCFCSSSKHTLTRSAFWALTRLANYSRTAVTTSCIFRSDLEVWLFCFRLVVGWGGVGWQELWCICLLVLVLWFAKFSAEFQKGLLMAERQGRSAELRCDFYRQAVLHRCRPNGEALLEAVPERGSTDAAGVGKMLQLEQSHFRGQTTRY